MTWVKICGITNVQDALTAVDAGADALGFVFYEPSTRNVTQETARDIVRQLPAKVEKVGVFVDETLDEMERVAEVASLTGIQLHLNLLRSPRDPSIGRASKTAKYIAIRGNDLFDEEGRFGGFGWREGADRFVRAIFLDSSSETQPGGTGIRFDWNKAVEAVGVIQQSIPVVVAGGLTSTNVREAMRILKPWGVDVSTGVEARPGKKDPEKVRAFVAAVRNADREA
jgi:phosphoribosylanthranilate isomerase